MNIASRLSLRVEVHGDGIFETRHLLSNLGHRVKFLHNKCLVSKYHLRVPPPDV